MVRLNSRVWVRIGVMCAMAALVFGYVTAKPASAQVLYGSMVGAIEDQTGAAVPKATVTITNKDTGATRTAAADDQGRYSLLNVQAGAYDLKVSATGFRTVNETDILVAINTVTRRDMRLEIGAMTEQVTAAGRSEERRVGE